MKRPKIVERISRMMRLNFPDVETIPYGSEARGTAREDSDIDLLILLPNDKSIIELRQKINDLIYDIELEFLATISTVFYLKEDWGQARTPFYINVTNEGIRI